jgi:hypothetical protein
LRLDALTHDGPTVADFPAFVAPTIWQLTTRDDNVATEGETAMNPIKTVQMTVLLAAATLLYAPASRADDVAIAQIKTESGAVYATRDGKRVDIKAGDELYEKDVLDTGADGAIGLTFTDNSVLSLGPNSEAALSEYRFDSSNFNGAMITDIHKGTLTMVSGDIARSSPGAMKVRTPTAILGVRGTSFAVDVGGN